MKPKEGNIVKITFLNVYEYKRNYILVVWPHKDFIYRRTTNDYSGESPFIINMNGEFSTNDFGFSYDKNICVFTKPNLKDMLEISQMLKINGFKYHRGTRELVRVDKKS